MKITILLATFALARELQAQYALNWSTVGAGGGSISGGAYTLEGTVGQPDAGQLSGGAYIVDGGFWAGLFSSPALVIARTGAEALLSWTGGGFILQSADDVAGPWADFSAGVSADGVNYHLNTSLSERTKFFRLREGL